MRSEVATDSSRLSSAIPLLPPDVVGEPGRMRTASHHPADAMPRSRDVGKSELQRWEVVLSTSSCKCALRSYFGNIMDVSEKMGCILMPRAFKQEVDSCNFVPDLLLYLVLVALSKLCF